MRLSPRSSTDAVLHLAGQLAPIFGGVADLADAVGDVEIDRRLGLAVDDDAVEAGAFQLGSPIAAGLSLAKAAGQRRLAGHGVAVAAGERQAIGDAGHDDQVVLRPQRIGADRDIAQHEVAGHGAAAQILAIDEFARFFDPGATFAQVDVQNFAVVSSRHCGFSSYR